MDLFQNITNRKISETGSATNNNGSSRIKLISLLYLKMISFAIDLK